MNLQALPHGPDYDKLWKNSSLEDIRQTQRLLHSDAAAKVEELRCLIGDKFRELLQTTDSIREMKLELESADRDFQDLHSMFNEATNILANAKAAAARRIQLEEDAGGDLYESKQRQVTALFAPERSWEEMDKGRLQFSVDEYFKGVRAFEALENRTDPFWDEHFELLQDLPRQIKQLCHDRLIDTNEPLRDEDALRALIAVDALSFESALLGFLNCRMKSIQQLIASGDPDGRIAFTLRITISECYNWFGEPGKIKDLGQGLVRNLASDWAQITIQELILQAYSDMLLAYTGSKLAEVRDHILNVLFRDSTNSWPAAVIYSLGSDINQLWQSMFFDPIKKAIVHHASHLFEQVPHQFQQHLDELEPAVCKSCEDRQQSNLTRYRRNSIFWRQVVDMNYDASDPFLGLVESIGQRFGASLRSLSTTAHALLDSSVASSLGVTDLVDLLSVEIHNEIDRGYIGALSQVANCIERHVAESQNAHRSVFYGRISRRFWAIAVCSKSLVHADKFEQIQSRYSSGCLHAYQLWINTNAMSITGSLRENLSSTIRLWALLKPELLSCTWASVGDVQVPCHASPFAVSFLYDLNHAIQTLHCAEFDGLVNAHVCAGICDQVSAAINDGLESVEALSQFFKIQLLFDVMFIFSQINVPSHILSSYDIPSTSSINAACTIRAFRSLIEPVILATSDQALRGSVRVQSARCSVIFGSISQSIPPLDSNVSSQSLNRVANIAPLLATDVPRLPSIPVNLYVTRELKANGASNIIVDAEASSTSSILTSSPTLNSISKREDRTGLSSGVATSATKWLADASLGISTATSGLSSMFKHYSKQQHQ